MNGFNQLTTIDISQCLQNTAQPSYDIPLTQVVWREAGVLVPFVRVEQEWHLLFIRRPDSEHDMHSGQVAFAGGKRDEEDKDIIQTALREADEELGINPQDVSVLGILPIHRSISLFSITPVVGILPWPYRLTLNQDEVAKAFTIPVAWLANPENREVHYKHLPQVSEPVPVIYFKKYQGELLWGATARMVVSLLDCLYKQVLSYEKDAETAPSP